MLAVHSKTTRKLGAPNVIIGTQLKIGLACIQDGGVDEVKYWNKTSEIKQPLSHCKPTRNAYLLEIMHTARCTPARSPPDTTVGAW